jgi:hypothetical protein
MIDDKDDDDIEESLKPDDDKDDDITPEVRERNYQQVSQILDANLALTYLISKLLPEMSAHSQPIGVGSGSWKGRTVSVALCFGDRIDTEVFQLNVENAMGVVAHGVQEEWLKAEKEDDDE